MNNWETWVIDIAVSIESNLSLKLVLLITVSAEQTNKKDYFVFVSVYFHIFFHLVKY